MGSFNSFSVCFQEQFRTGGRSGELMDMRGKELITGHNCPHLKDHNALIYFITDVISPFSILSFLFFFVIREAVALDVVQGRT